MNLNLCAHKNCHTFYIIFLHKNTESQRANFKIKFCKHKKLEYADYVVSADLREDGSALEVVLHDYALYKSTFTLLYLLSK